MAKESLKNKTIKGVGWSAVDNVSQHFVTFVVGIILARLLSPDDYGLLGIIAIFTAVCNTLINAGFSNALIRKNDASDDDYSTVFIVNLGLSLLLYSIIFACSPLIATFFNREELVDLTRVSSLTMVIGAFAIVQQTRLTKRLDFKSQTKISLASSILSGVIGVGMATIGFGVWSLVCQQLSNQTIRTFLLWLVNKWTPSIRFSIQSFKELFGFGWKMMASGILDTVWQELNQVIVGKFYSPATLGQYTRSISFSTMLTSNLTSIVQRVTYPVLSNIQDDKTRMASAYRRMIKLTMFITAISSFTLGAVAEPLLYCLIGPQWHEAATYLPLICITGSFYPLHAMNLNMLKVQGRSDLFLLLEIIKKIIALGPLFIGAFIGIMPMLYTTILTSIIAYFLNSYYSGRFLGYSSWMQIRDVAPSYLIAIAIAIPVYLIKYLPMSEWIILPMQIVVALVVFFVICIATNNEEFNEIKYMIIPYIKKYH